MLSKLFLNSSTKSFSTKATPRGITHYNAKQKILLVGEGDFSFGHCLARAFRDASKLTATTEYSFWELRSKHFHADWNIRGLHNHGAKVLYDVDALRMSGHRGLWDEKFDRIVFNLPHAGFRRVEDVPAMISEHSALVKKFFKESTKMLDLNGQIHVTHKTGKPYDDWDIVGSAAKAELELLETADFNRADYPGYCPKRGAGRNPDQGFNLKGLKTFKFVKS